MPRGKGRVEKTGFHFILGSVIKPDKEIENMNMRYNLKSEVLGWHQYFVAAINRMFSFDIQYCDVICDYFGNHMTTLFI